jgi:diguanylate cyclase (GGDEF)-like protein
MREALKAKTGAAVAWAVENGIQVFVWSCLASHAFFIIWFGIAQVWPCVVLNILSTGFYLYLAVIRREFSETDMVLAYFEIIVFATVSSLIVGLECGYFMYIFGMMSIVFLFAPSKGNLRYLFMFIGFLLLAFAQVMANSPATAVFVAMREAFAPYMMATWFINFVVVMAIVIVSSFLFSRSTHENLARLDKLSYTDELTGLGNRRYLESKMSLIGENYALAMLDIDDFKLVNDTYGHDKGDIVLRSIAAVMRTHVRAGDVVVRWGGEEFVLCLPGCPIEPALRIMNGIREEVAKLAFDAMPGEHMTVTIGVTVSGARPYDEVVRESDEAMYRGKRRGKNRVIAA